jgi:3'-phosphoadenosine 5'-phosphosulfate sulfotransferase (PAPS reductase)/FAD synthetase
MLKSAVFFQLFISPLFLPVWASRVSVVKKLGDKEVVDLNRRFANASLTEVLHWATDQFAGHVAQLTSFGVTGLVVADMLQREKLLNAVPQVTIDTLHLFPETESCI